MDHNPTVIASGNLASSQRTVTGLLGQLVFLNVSDEDALALFNDAGLPARALAEPDFPISLEQELIICMALVRRFLGHDRSAVRVFFQRMDSIGIENLGVLGMAMRHAATAVAALQVCLNFPQLTWGHSRLVVSRASDVSLFTFTMQRPQIRDTQAADIDALVNYCLTLDLVTSLRNIQDIATAETVPLYITFPFAQPADWHLVQESLPCAVEFSCAEACLAFSGGFDNAPLPKANPLVYRSYVTIAEKLSLMLAEEISLTERVTRWLWAYTPPLKRGEVAGQLSMSERSLTRQLGREGTSYASLLANVQAERARNYMRNPNLTVSEIGYRLGYTEPATFTRAFTKWTGSSPLKWRKLHIAPGSDAD
ncbi:putative HTH-type transcriptional regulator [Halioglobus japonicus]|nr:putative HTH-type transcriptional regulator [Halioglobus japonicus]